MGQHVRTLTPNTKMVWSKNHTNLFSRFRCQARPGHVDPCLGGLYEASLGSTRKQWDPNTRSPLAHQCTQPTLQICQAGESNAVYLVPLMLNDCTKSCWIVAQNRHRSPLFPPNAFCPLGSLSTRLYPAVAQLGIPMQFYSNSPPRGICQ